ncbi:hypothetical protein CYMTET_21347 [Cymbomonas tetramitiformis]|uniref:Uncharacterized protein n=1 Tax=Cymbomonas tetramitiformis TaxID=36881 RepID=A0AAE0L395_9CHLO|nr:hypothetical protein CYMTET_21347 [Cymbomonas tetramitiformis]
MEGDDEMPHLVDGSSEEEDEEGEEDALGILDDEMPRSADPLHHTPALSVSTPIRHVGNSLPLRGAAIGDTATVSIMEFWAILGDSALVKRSTGWEMQLDTGKVATDETLRTFIEDCVENLRIKIFQTRVKEQLRAQYPPPNRVTWKDLEAIVEHGLDLKAIKNSIKKVESAVDGQSGDPEGKKKVDTSPSKKMKKEVNVAERATKPTYNNAPPPAERSRTNDKRKCLRCFGGGWHESNPEQCRSGYKHAKLPAGYHEGKLGSSKWWEAENAAIRMYNLKNRFKNSEWGILVTDWQQLSNEEKDKYRAAPAQDEKRSPAGKANSLKAEYQGMVAARKTASRDGSVKSQVLSEDEGSDEELIASGVAEREIYSSDTHEVNHREVPGSGLPAASSSSVLSALAEVMGAGGLADALATLNLEGLSGARDVEDKPEVMAAPAVALGSTQHMKGFPVKAPEEYEAEAQLPSAPAADEMQRMVQFMASGIKSLGPAIRKLAAGLVAEGRITAPRGVETLVELAEAGQLPMQAALAADLSNCQSCDDGDDSDDDCPEGLESAEEERVTVTAAAAAIQDKFGVTDFSVRGKLHAGTMEAKAYELLKKKMLSGLTTEEQLTAMAQVQTVCKLLNDTLAQGMALVASGGLLMLYTALLFDTGANCNIIPIRAGKQLGLTIFDAATGARVARVCLTTEIFDDSTSH